MRNLLINMVIFSSFSSLASAQPVFFASENASKNAGIQTPTKFHRHLASSTAMEPATDEQKGKINDLGINGLHSVKYAYNLLAQQGKVDDFIKKVAPVFNVFDIILPKTVPLRHDVSSTLFTQLGLKMLRKKLEDFPQYFNCDPGTLTPENLQDAWKWMMEILIGNCHIARYQSIIEEMQRFKRVPSVIIEYKSLPIATEYRSLRLRERAARFNTDGLNLLSTAAEMMMSAPQKRRRPITPDENVYSPAYPSGVIFVSPYVSRPSFAEKTKYNSSQVSGSVVSPDPKIRITDEPPHETALEDVTLISVSTHQLSPRNNDDKNLSNFPDLRP